MVMLRVVWVVIALLCCITSSRCWRMTPATNRMVNNGRVRSSRIASFHQQTSFAELRRDLRLRGYTTEEQTASTDCNSHSHTASTDVTEFNEADIMSSEIRHLIRKIEAAQVEIAKLQQEVVAEEQAIALLNKEYGPQIERIKKEFARMQERSYEEAADASKQAKIAALKDILPITDNFFRAKSIYDPLQTQNEEAIFHVYNETFHTVLKVIEDFGIQKIDSLGKQFDYNTMEAIQTQASLEYAKGVVCKEYQIGYVMGDKCVRPAMVVVSLGPGSQS